MDVFYASSLVTHPLLPQSLPMPMQNKIDTGSSGRNAHGRLHLVLGAIGLVAPVLTFILAVSSIGYNYKIAGLAAVAVVYLAICVWSYFLSRREDDEPLRADGSAGNGEPTGDIHGKLLALQEANQFFGSSLKPADMFRLVSSRVGDICQFSASAVFVFDETKTKLRIAHADGKNAGLLQDMEVAADAGLAGMAVVSREVERDGDMMIERFSLPDEALEGFRSAVAMPLIHEGEVFGVYQLYSESKLDAGADSLSIFEAIGEHVSPLFRSSIAFEQSVSTALTDALTGLPNERAFYMVLENQLAESMRYRDERPLTVVAIDIKGFAEVNSSLGHQTGDRILKFAGEQIKEHLRKMDFLARSINDEFVMILPTAAEKTALEIIERIKAGFAQKTFAISKEENVKIWLNFGWATFWKDGETTQQLIRNAQLRKQQEKSEEPAGVLWFPKEYVN